MARENKSKYAIMGILSSCPGSGYDIKKKIEKGVGYFWQEGYGQIYPILKQLEAEGLATKSTEEQQGKPDRHIYTLTAAGRQELVRWLYEPVDPPVPREEILLKLFFGNLVAPVDNLQHVQRFRASNLEMLQTCQAIEAELCSTFSEDARLPYWLMTISYFRHKVQAMIVWSDETLEKLAQMRGADPAHS